MKVVGGSASVPLARGIAKEVRAGFVDVAFEKHPGGFPDGERYVRLLGPVAQGAATFLAAQFNAGLEAILQGLESGSGLNIVRFDVFQALNEIVAAPGAFGLTNVTQPCIAVDTNAQPFCANPGTFLFWDGIHPTVAGHRILAKRARAALNATP